MARTLPGRNRGSSTWQSNANETTRFVPEFQQWSERFPLHYKKHSMETIIMYGEIIVRRTIVFALGCF